MKSEEQDEWCMSSGAKLIQETKDEDGATEQAGLLLNTLGSDCVAPSPSHVVVIPGERLHAYRPNRRVKLPRRRPSLPTATRPTVWIVQVSAILVTLAMTASIASVCFLREAEGRSQQDGSAAVELHMEGDVGAGKNNSSDAFSGVSIPSIYKFTTKYTIPGNAPEAAKLTAEKQRRVVTSSVAALASITSEPGRLSMPQRFTLPILVKAPTTPHRNTICPPLRRSRKVPPLRGMGSAWRREGALTPVCPGRRDRNHQTSTGHHLCLLRNQDC